MLWVRNEGCLNSILGSTAKLAATFFNPIFGSGSLINLSLAPQRYHATRQLVDRAAWGLTHAAQSLTITEPVSLRISSDLMRPLKLLYNLN